MLKARSLARSNFAFDLPMRSMVKFSLRNALSKCSMLSPGDHPRRDR